MATHTETMMRRFEKAHQGEKPTPKEALEWFRKTVRKTAITPARLMQEEQQDMVNTWQQMGLGKVYNYVYTPKHRNDVKKLPYFDRFPLMIPIRRYNDGLLGLNLHYLPPAHRVILLEKLFETENNAFYNDTKKMQINYTILKGAANRFSGYAPCVKRYLGTHFSSRIIRVPYDKWALCAMLPSETFVRASRQKVWADSKKLMNK